MKVLIAGATGAIGRPLVRCLNQHHHTVVALARSQESLRALKELGAEPVIADALDETSVKAIIGEVRPDAVINELTSLPRHYTPEEIRSAAERDRKVRTEGNANLLAACQDAGVRRYVLQSCGFWYAAGTGLADESTQFAVDASPAVAAGAQRYAELEAAASGAPNVEFVGLRYGFFYGPGTWYDTAGDMGEQVRQQRVPILGAGQGVWSWVHVDDAAEATAAALACAPGVYNVVDGDPTTQSVWLPAFARAVGARPPLRVSEDEAVATLGPDAVYYATQLRGASNEKARRGLNFRPRRLEWLDLP